MKTERIGAALMAFWFCLSPLIEKDDGTLPLPQLQSVDETKATDSLWDLLCL